MKSPWNHAASRVGQDVDRPLEMIEAAHPTLGGGILLLDKAQLAQQQRSQPNPFFRGSNAGAQRIQSLNPIELADFQILLWFMGDFHGDVSSGVRVHSS